jgi:acyl-coenzyme A thioesterase PaaI-like protein
VVLKGGETPAVRLSKKERQRQLTLALQQNPFATDEEMARQFGVSIQTIRLDRMELGIPELRERIKHMAEENFDRVRSLAPEEVIGEIVELHLDRGGTSILEIKREHVFSRNRIARGHYLFAQANSLAVAIIDAEIVLTASASIRFLRPVRLGEKCVARAKVVKESAHRVQVDVRTYVEEEIVFQGVFDMYRASGDEAVKLKEGH